VITPGLRPIIMGILNVTPDSFSDGGCWFDTDTAVERAVRMVEEGAAIIDIGGESTRPGAARLSAAIQIERVLPVIKAVIKCIPANIGISIDTTLVEVARAAIDAGARMINDISAGRDDVDMLRLAAQSDTRLVLMHMQGTPATMQKNPVYTNVVEQVRQFLLERAAAANQAGVQDEQIILDPGIGFGKTLDHNIELMKNLHRFTDTGYPVLLGASRKRFLKALCNNGQHDTLVGASCATTALGVLAGVRIFRVHDVSENRQTADVVYRHVSQESQGVMAVDHTTDGH
jgi:dihydropteroate synthase